MYQHLAFFFFNDRFFDKREKSDKLNTGSAED